jgi:hypothetical protein
MKKLILVLFSIFSLSATLTVENIAPDQIIKISGDVEDGYIFWKLAPKYVQEQVELNLTHNPNDPYTVHLENIETPTHSAKLIMAHNNNSLEEALQELFDHDENHILDILNDLEKLGAAELQKAAHKILIDMEHFNVRQTLHQTKSAKKVALHWPNKKCTFGKDNCKMTLKKECPSDFDLVDAGPELLGKCRKFVTPVNKECQHGSQKVFNQFDPTKLICAKVKDPNPCPHGFTEQSPTHCKQIMQCTGNQEMIKAGPNKGMCKKKHV